MMVILTMITKYYDNTNTDNGDNGIVNNLFYFHCYYYKCPGKILLLSL